MKKPLSKAALMRFLRINDACSEGMERAAKSRAKTARGVYLSSHVTGSDIWFLGTLCCGMERLPTTVVDQPGFTAARARQVWPWHDIEPRVRAGLAAARAVPASNPHRRYIATTAASCAEAP